MDLPDRDANSDDPITYPFRGERTANNSHDEAAWLRWRLTDPELDADLRSIMEVEAIEVEQLALLLAALETAQGDTLEEKMGDPLQRDTLRALSLRWLRAQRALLDATTNTLDRRAGGNGH
jgi:hypothetical protein